MKAHGALTAMMSGSGPTVFGLFRDRRMAREAQKAIRDRELAAGVYYEYTQCKEEIRVMEPKFWYMDEYLPLRDVVFNMTAGRILRGELKPGERLMEIQFANKLGVSRTPIRGDPQAGAEGLVLMIPRKGAEVAEITEKSLKDVLEVRRALEELAVEIVRR